jgi:RNA polymerase sigma-70 factor (ECF subfamily)
MPGTTEEFRVLMERVLAGNQTAAAELWSRFGPAVRRAVRARLSKRMRSKFDSLDFAQDVWASFFAAPAEAADFADSGRFLAFLTQVARNKVVDAVRQRLQGQKYNVNRECSLDRSTAGGPNQVPAQQPTPSEVVGGREEWDQVLAGQPPAFRRILLLARDGKNLTDIAAELQIHPRSVRRVLDRVMARYTP